MPVLDTEGDLRRAAVRLVRTPAPLWLDPGRGRLVSLRKRNFGVGERTGKRRATGMGGHRQGRGSRAGVVLAPGLFPLTLEGPEEPVVHVLG